MGNYLLRVHPQVSSQDLPSFPTKLQELFSGAIRQQLVTINSRGNRQYQTLLFSSLITTWIGLFIHRKLELGLLDFSVMEAQIQESAALTESQWYGLKQIAAQREVSLSDLLDKLSSGELVVIDPVKLEDRLDLLDALETIAEMKAGSEQPLTWEQVEAEIKH